MNPKISIIMPSIRTNLLQGVYESIQKSFSGEFELIIIGPYPLPDALKDKENIVYIEDHGNPIRCRQRGLCVSRGTYICYAADDVIFYPQSLDIAYASLKDKDYKTLVVGKYLEGSQDNPFMQSDEYWYLYTHDFLKPIMPDDKRNYLLINTGLISRELMFEIGGFDCSFEACAMACVDLSIRLQNYGATCILQDQAIFHSTHLPGDTGDHEPIDSAQVRHDQPLFLMRYMNRFNYTKIQLDNWKDSPEWWGRRFGVRNG